MKSVVRPTLRQTPRILFRRSLYGLRASNAVMRLTNRKTWLTSADDDVLRFVVPPDHRRDGYAVAGLLASEVPLFALVAVLAPQIAKLWLCCIVPFGIVGASMILYLYSLSEVTIDLKSRTYKITSRWLWYTSLSYGSLDDFQSVEVSASSKWVSLVFKRPSLRVITIGRAGFGGDGVQFAQQVARKTGLEVTTRL